MSGSSSSSLKERALDVLADSAQGVRDSVKERWGDFRATSIYFQLKAFLLLVYIGLVAVTVFFVPLGSTDNTIGARIVVLDGDIVVGRYFVITNESRSHWKDVRVEVDNGFSVERDLVPAGTSLELFSTSFRKQEMRMRRGREIPKWVRAPLNAQLTRLQLSTSEGSASAPIPAVGGQETTGFLGLFR